MAVVRPPISPRRVNPSPAIQGAPLGARDPGGGRGGTGLGGFGGGAFFYQQEEVFRTAYGLSLPTPYRYLRSDVGAVYRQALKVKRSARRVRLPLPPSLRLPRALKIDTGLLARFGGCNSV